MSLTQGLELSCNLRSTAGLEECIYLAPCDWLDDPAFTIAGDGALSDIAIDVAKSGGPTGLYKFDLKRNANGYTGEAGGSVDNIFFTQTVTLVIPKMAQASRNAIMEMLSCRCGLIGIVVDNNCKQWVLGFQYDEDCSKEKCKGLRVDAGTSETTGIDETADQNEYTVTLTAIVRELAREYTTVIPVNP